MHPTFMLLLALALLAPPSAAHALGDCPSGGFAGALCDLRAARQASFCGPRSLKRKFARALGRAQLSVRQAKRARAAQVQTALSRADRQLTAALVPADAALQ